MQAGPVGRSVERRCRVLCPLSMHPCRHGTLLACADDLGRTCVALRHSGLQDPGLRPQIPPAAFLYPVQDREGETARPSPLGGSANWSGYVHAPGQLHLLAEAFSHSGASLGP